MKKNIVLKNVFVRMNSFTAERKMCLEKCPQGKLAPDQSQGLV